IAAGVSRRAATRSAFQTGRPAATTSSTDSSPENWTASGSIAATISAIRPRPASAVIATIRGAVVERDRATRARATASPSSRARGVPGTRLRPIASAPDRTAARTPSASVIPQTFASAVAALLAGSDGGWPAATKARAAAAGSSARARASPASAASNPAALDDELLRQDRDGNGRPDRSEVVDRAAEPVRLAQDRDRGRAAGFVSSGSGDDVLARRRDLARRRRGPLDLGDEVEARRRQRRQD